MIARRRALAAIACFAAGCGSSSSTPSPAGDGGSQGTVCVTIHDDDKIIPWTSTALPVYACDANKSTTYPDGGNACRNTSDCAKMAECNSQCVVDTTKMKIMDPGISPACGACYTDVALCSLAYCLSECAANADAPECVKCQFESGCRVPFERCSGLDRN